MGGAIPEGATNVSPLSVPLKGYEVSVLFLVFVGISVSWEVVLGVLTFLNNLLRGKQANWLMRVKEELLALGVVSLVLLFLEPVISSICEPSDYTTDWVPPEESAAVQGAYYVCPSGSRNVFPAAVIHAAHYLLFYLAVVHILFNMLTNSITSQKFDCMVVLERKARNQDMAHEQAMVHARLHGADAIDATLNPLLAATEAGSSSGSGSGSAGSNDSGSDTGSKEKKEKGRVRKAWEASTAGQMTIKVWWLVKRSVDQKSFSLLRKVCIQRFEAHAMDSNVRSFSYVNIASQVLEADLEQVYAHAWLMILFMTFLLMYPRIVYQVIWANVMCLVAVAVMSWKIHHVLHDTVDICRRALQKGVEQQRHLRKVEASMALAGSDFDSSESGGATDATSAAKSFAPYKRAASMKRSASLTREEQMGSFMGVHPAVKAVGMPAGVAFSGGTIGHLDGLSGAMAATEVNPQDDDEYEDADHILEAYQRRQQKEAARKAREAIEKERTAHLANTLDWVIGTSGQSDEYSQGGGASALQQQQQQQVAMMQEQLRLLRRVQEQRSGRLPPPPPPPHPPHPPPPAPPPAQHDPALPNLVTRPTGQRLASQRSGILLPSMHSVQSAQSHVALMPMMPAGLHSVAYTGHHTPHSSAHHHHHHHAHYQGPSAHAAAHTSANAASHGPESTATHTHGHAAGHTPGHTSGHATHATDHTSSHAADIAAGFTDTSAKPDHAWRGRRGSMPRNPALLNGQLLNEQQQQQQQQQQLVTAAVTQYGPSGSHISSATIVGSMLARQLPQVHVEVSPSVLQQHHSITISSPAGQLSTQLSGSVPKGWSTGGHSPTSTSHTPASAAALTAVPTSWSAGGATPRSAAAAVLGVANAVQAVHAGPGAVQAVQAVPQSWSTGVPSTTAGAAAGAAGTAFVQPATSVPLPPAAAAVAAAGWATAGADQASTHQVLRPSATFAAQVHEQGSPRGWTIGPAAANVNGADHTSAAGSHGNIAGQNLQGWASGCAATGSSQELLAANVVGADRGGVGTGDLDAALSAFNRQFLDYSQQQMQQQGGASLMPGWGAQGSKHHDHLDPSMSMQHTAGPAAPAGGDWFRAAAARASSLKRSGSVRQQPGMSHKVRFAGGSDTPTDTPSAQSSKSSDASRGALYPANSIKLKYRGPAHADAVVDAKHARERAKGHHNPLADEPHLPYKTLAELAEEVEKRVKNLFWFRHPHFILWMVNIIFLISSLSITTAVALVIPYNKFQKLASLKQDTVIWLPVVATDVIMALYLSWHVLPLYALITTAGTSFPPRVIEEVRAAKTLAHDDHHGISGMILGFLNHVFVGVEHKERQESLDLATYFVTSLSDHAGIVLSPHLRTAAAKGAITIMARAEVRDVLREFAQFWHDVAWYGPPEDDYVIKADLSFMREAFGELDADGSGALSFGELAQMVRALGALATAGDIETMLWEVDLDGSRSVGFDEFTKFLAYAFFDIDANGFIGVDEVEDSMLRLGFKKATPEACAMLMSAADHNGDGRLGMREFFMLFEKLQVEEDEDGSGSGDGSNSNSNSSASKGSKK